MESCRVTRLTGLQPFPMLLFCLVLSLARYIYASRSEANRMDLGNFMFVRSFTPEPSTEALPYILASHNLERDLQVGYLRSFDEMIEGGLDIIVLNPKTSSRKGTSFSLRETSRAAVPKIIAEMDIINVINYGQHVAFRYIKETIGDTSSIFRIVYDASRAEDSLIIYVKDVAIISSYVIGYDLDDSRATCEIADCANIRELELFKQVYSLGNVTRSHKGESSAGISLWNTAIYDYTINSLITIFLKPDDNSDLFWNLMKDIMEDNMAKSRIARICLRRFFESGIYNMTFYLPHSPSMVELERYRSILKKHLGPLTTFNETKNVQEGINLFSTVRVGHSELTLSVKLPNQKGSKNVVVESEAVFRGLMNQNSNAVSYKISRSLQPKHSTSEYPAQLTLPFTGRKTLFERVVSCIFFSKFFYFSDQVSMVEVRATASKLSLNVTFHFMTKANRTLAMELLASLASERVTSMAENNFNTLNDLTLRLPKPAANNSEPLTLSNAKNCKFASTLVAAEQMAIKELSERVEGELKKTVPPKKKNPAKPARALGSLQHSETEIPEPDHSDNPETTVESRIEVQSEPEEQPKRRYLRAKRSETSSSSKTQTESSTATIVSLEKMTNREFEEAFEAFCARLQMKTFEEHLQSRIN